MVWCCPKGTGFQQEIPVVRMFNPEFLLCWKCHVERIHPLFHCFSRVLLLDSVNSVFPVFKRVVHVCNIVCRDTRGTRSDGLCLLPFWNQCLIQMTSVSFQIKVSQTQVFSWKENKRVSPLVSGSWHANRKFSSK